MKWNYAELSKLAKELGGPDELVDHFINVGIEMEKRKFPLKATFIFASGLILSDTIKYIKRYVKDNSLPFEKNIANEITDTTVTDLE